MRPISALRIGSRSGSSSGYAGGALDTQTVGTGSDGTVGAGNRRSGFIIGTLGSVSDGTSNLYAGAAIRQLYSGEQGVGAGFDTFLTVTGVVANSGWTSMNVGGTHVLTRASASFSTGGGNSTWDWAATGKLFTAGGAVVGFD